MKSKGLLIAGAGLAALLFLMPKSEASSPLPTGGGGSGSGGLIVIEAQGSESARQSEGGITYVVNAQAPTFPGIPSEWLGADTKKSSSASGTFGGGAEFAAFRQNLAIQQSQRFSTGNVSPNSFISPTKKELQAISSGQVMLSAIPPR